MKMQFEAAAGNKNILVAIDTEDLIFAEVEVPDGASDDYGYLTMKKAIIEHMPIDFEGDLEWQYDGQEQFLAPDAEADCKVDLQIDCDAGNFYGTV